MPYISDPANFSSSPLIQTQLSSYLLAYAGQVLSQGYWATPNGDDMPYKKRQILAKTILAGNKQYVASFGILLGSMANQDLDAFAVSQGAANLYSWLVSNTALEIEYVLGNFGGINQVGTQLGTSIFDKLAGVDMLDMQ